MSEYNLTIMDIEWVNGNMYETSRGEKLIVREGDLYFGDDAFLDYFSLARITKTKLKKLTDWSKVPVDTKVLVRSFPNDPWEKRHFAKWQDGFVYCFPSGQTSWSSNKATPTSWLYAKLAEEEVE